MSYEPTVWKSGDVVTSAKLNKLEQGVAGGGGLFKVNAEYDESTDTLTLDKTWKEIRDAVVSGLVPYIVSVDDGFVEEISACYFQKCYKLDDRRRNIFVDFANIYIEGDASTASIDFLRFTANTEDDYPVHNYGNT